MKDPFWVLFRLNLLIFFVNYFCLQKKLNSANNGNKRRNLMQIKILDYEVYLPLHTFTQILAQSRPGRIIQV